MVSPVAVASTTYETDPGVALHLTLAQPSVTNAPDTEALVTVTSLGAVATA